MDSLPPPNFDPYSYTFPKYRREDSGRDHCQDTPTYQDSTLSLLLSCKASPVLRFHWDSLL
jgi:hypothetical protein